MFTTHNRAAKAVLSTAFAGALVFSGLGAGSAFAADDATFVLTVHDGSTTKTYTKVEDLGKIELNSRYSKTKTFTVEFKMQNTDASAAGDYNFHAAGPAGAPLGSINYLVNPDCEPGNCKDAQATWLKKKLSKANLRDSDLT
ncbi:MAG: hypothetical protein CR979_02450, partial [Propionibacterium sp.]